MSVAASILDEPRDIFLSVPEGAPWIEDPDVDEGPHGRLLTRSEAKAIYTALRDVLDLAND